MKRKKLKISKNGNVIVTEKNIQTPYTKAEKFSIGFEKKLKMPTPIAQKTKYNRKRIKKDW